MLRAVKVTILFALGCFAAIGSTNAATVPISPGGSYVLDGGNTYSGGMLSAPSIASFVHNYTFSVASGDLPFSTLTISTALPGGPPGPSGIKLLTVEWLSPTNVSLGTLLVTNSLGNVTGNPPLVVGLSLLAEVGNYILKVSGTPTHGGDGYLLNITTTPLPPALLLFGSALAGLGLLGRRRRRATNTLAP
jgi:hypothetical protein